MADSYSRDDGRDRTTVIETRSGGGGMVAALILGIVVVAALIWFLVAQNRNDTVRTDAVSSAAQSVGDAAKDAGRSVGDAVDRTTK